MSFGASYPELAKEWHPTKNGDLTPFDVAPKGHNKVWWKCDKADDHEWQTAIYNRTSGKGCPYCANRLVVLSNCLATLNPELTKQWHPTKNGDLTPFDITPGSAKKVWWKCEENHEWATAIAKRSGNENVKGTNCPECDRFMDLTGQTFDLLTVLEPVGVNEHRSHLWRCQCSCPDKNIVIRSTSSLRYTRKKSSCGCIRGAQLLDRVFSLLTVIERIGLNKHGQYLWLCRCSCPAGNTRTAMSAELLSGKINACLDCSAASKVEAIRASRPQARATFVTNRNAETEARRERLRELGWEGEFPEIREITKELVWDLTDQGYSREVLSVYFGVRVGMIDYYKAQRPGYVPKLTQEAVEGRKQKILAMDAPPKRDDPLYRTYMYAIKHDTIFYEMCADRDWIDIPQIERSAAKKAAILMMSARPTEDHPLYKSYRHYTSSSNAGKGFDPIFTETCIQRKWLRRRANMAAETKATIRALDAAPVEGDPLYSAYRNYTSPGRLCDLVLRQECIDKRWLRPLGRNRATKQDIADRKAFILSQNAPPKPGDPLYPAYENDRYRDLVFRQRCIDKGWTHNSSPDYFDQGWASRRRPQV